MTKLLPCHLHPHDKPFVERLEDNAEELWEATCGNASCAHIGVSRFHAVMRWNDFQKRITRWNEAQKAP